MTSGGDNAPTATDGWVQYGLQPEQVPDQNGYSVQFYVKAYRASDPTLGGIYGSPSSRWRRSGRERVCGGP